MNVMIINECDDDKRDDDNEHNDDNKRDDDNEYNDDNERIEVKW